MEPKKQREPQEHPRFFERLRGGLESLQDTSQTFERVVIDNVSAFTPWLAPLIPHLDAWHPQHAQISRAAVDRWHAQGLFVNAWTANQASTIRALIKAGVDGIIGDDPILIQDVLKPPSGVFDLPLLRDLSGG